MTEQYVRKLLPQHVHACENYDPRFLNVLQTLVDDGGKFIIFQNSEGINIINGDITYLNIISEGLIKLLRDLKADNLDGYRVEIIIAVRKNVHGVGIIKEEEYRIRLEEKIQLALGKEQIIPGQTYSITFKDARAYRRLDFADIICNTWLTRNSKKFTEDDKAVISSLYDSAGIYSVFEDTLTSYCNRMVFERHYSEGVYLYCSYSSRPEKTARLRKKLIDAILKSDTFEQESCFSQISLIIGQYNNTYMYENGIKLAENYLKYFLAPLEEQIQPGRQTDIRYWAFDTHFYLLTMYDHIGNPRKCQEHLQACRERIDSVNHSWEHIDYYFNFCIRELNVLMGRLDFETVIERSEELVKIFSEARDLFSIIKTYNDTEQSLQSELLGKTYGVQTEAYINLLHEDPTLYDKAIEASDKAIKEFVKERDLSRQYQWRCLLMAEADKPDKALENLLAANSSDSIEGFLSKAFSMSGKGYDFLIWHYTNVMTLFKQHNNPTGDRMANLLLKDKVFISDERNPNKKGHPWNLTLWNISRYARMDKQPDLSKGMYRHALEITMENRDNVTMMLFALSMTADRVLALRQYDPSKVSDAEKDFDKVHAVLSKVGLTEGMMTKMRFKEIGTAKTVNNSDLARLAKVYLK